MRYLIIGLVLVPGLALADTVTFKNGSRMDGVTSMRGDTLEVRVPEGSFYFARGLVAKIEPAATPLQEFEKRRAALPAKDAKAAFELGVYAAANGLKAQAAEMFKRATALQPDHEAARERLGHRKIGGRWMSREELLTELGMVQVNGEWMSPRAARQLTELDERTRSLETRIAQMEIESTKLQTALEREQRYERDTESERRIAQLEGEVRGLRGSAQSTAPTYGYPYGYYYPYPVVTTVPVYDGRKRDRDRDRDRDTYPPKFGRMPFDPIGFPGTNR